MWGRIGVIVECFLFFFFYPLLYSCLPVSSFIFIFSLSVFPSPILFPPLFPSMCLLVDSSILSDGIGNY